VTAVWRFVAWQTELGPWTCQAWRDGVWQGTGHGRARVEAANKARTDVKRHYSATWAWRFGEAALAGALARNRGFSWSNIA
jgi:hypothetical protein